MTRARILGRRLYEEDLIAWWGTDVALEGAPEIANPARNPRGWVTTRDSSGWVVHFLQERDGALVEPVQVRFDRFHPSAGKLVRFDPPRAADPEVALLEKVKETASEAPPQRCTASYNFATLPGALVSETGWFHYLLPATTEAGAWVVGGQVRRQVAEDGTCVLRSDEMSRQCLVLPGNGVAPPRSGLVDVGKLVSNKAWPCPTEIHVWQTLLHRKPLFVENTTGTWVVEGDRIERIECTWCGTPARAGAPP